MNDRGPWIETFSAKRFYILDPRVEDVDMIDIAHALSHTCRYSGHTTELYTVAHHVLFVSDMMAYNHSSRLLDPRQGMLGLVHDFEEAYVGDVVSPMKRAMFSHPGMEEFWERMLEKINDCIYASIGFALPSEEENAIVHFFDYKALYLEAYWVLNGHGATFSLDDMRARLVNMADGIPSLAPPQSPIDDPDLRFLKMRQYQDPRKSRKEILERVAEYQRWRDFR